MSLGDYYVPDPQIFCPICAVAIERWEGFDGPGDWIEWHEQQKVPAAQPRPWRDPKPARLPDGQHSIFAVCAGKHHLLAHILVEESVWVGTEVADVEGDGGLHLLSGKFRLWRTRNNLFSVAPRTPTGADQVIPASITAIGFNDQCIVATRRASTRDPDSVDEWYVVDVAEGVAIGPIDDDDPATILAQRTLRAPELMKLPEEL